MMSVFAPTAEPIRAMKDSGQGFVNGLITRLPHIIAAVGVFIIFLAVAHAVRWGIQRATKKTQRASVGLVLGRVTYFATLVVGGLVAVTIVAPSMTPAKLVSMLGIGGVALGFAFKDLFQNLVAGILILWRQPFRVGDEITAKDFTGTVEAVETRATLIKTYDGKRVIIPNSDIYTTAVSVITAYDMLRTEYDVGVGYGDDLAKAKEILQEILVETEGVLQEPAPKVLVWELAESSVNLRAMWWTKPDRPTVIAIRESVLKQAKERLGGAGIDLPYPTRVLLFHDQTEETDGKRAEQREGWPTPPNGRAPRPSKIASALRRAAEGTADAPPSAPDGSRSH